MLAFVLIPLVALTMWGCASCRDQLLISVRDSKSREPVAGAEIEFRPRLAILPPPVWRGETDSNGELRICVDFAGRSLRMTIRKDGEQIFGSPFHSSDFENNDVIDASYDPQFGQYPRVIVIVQRLDR
jgi:hypothetical protein